MAWDWNTFWFVLIILSLLFLLVLTIIWWNQLRKKKEKGPSHIELYFDENFRKIMDEWDFASRDKVKDFKKNMSTRLGKVGADISVMENKRVDLEKRMDKVEKGMSKLEGL